SLGFIVFVVFMQQQFNNPEFSGLSATTTSQSEQANEETDANSDTVAGAANSMVSNEEGESEEENNNEESETETDEVTTSVRTVTAETLNARSGPGIEYEVTGVLVLDQVVEVEDHGEEWVKVTTEEFTGYVNKKYLTEEE